MEEVAFFHRVSRPAISYSGVLVSQLSGWKRTALRLDGLVGEHEGTPREWRATFLRRAAPSYARNKVLGWNAERLLIAHCACVQEHPWARSRRSRITLELMMLKRRVAEYPETAHAVMQSAKAVRILVTAVTTGEAEAWANPST